MAESDSAQSTVDESIEQRELRFRYLKSHFFRVIHADGAWGGISPRGDIHMSLYNERWAMPDSSRIVLGDGDKVLSPEEYEMSGEVIRELEADVVVDLDTARRLYVWLGQKIEEFETLIREAQKRSVDADQKTPSTK